jgi:hypothetical protein
LNCSGHLPSPLAAVFIHLSISLGAPPFWLERLTDKRAASCVEPDLMDSSFQTLARYLYR